MRAPILACWWLSVTALRASRPLAARPRRGHVADVEHQPAEGEQQQRERNDRRPVRGTAWLARSRSSRPAAASACRSAWRAAARQRATLPFRRVKRSASCARALWGDRCVLGEDDEAATAPPPASAPRRARPPSTARACRGRGRPRRTGSARHRGLASGLVFGGSGILGVSSVLAGHRSRYRPEARLVPIPDLASVRWRVSSADRRRADERGRALPRSPSSDWQKRLAFPGALAARAAPAPRSFRKTPSAVRILPGHVYFPSSRHRLGKPTCAAAGSQNDHHSRARGAVALLRAADRRDRRLACACRAAASAPTSPRRRGSGCCSAIRAWQPARGPFRAFAALCARNQALRALDAAGARKHQLLSRARSLDDHQPRAKAPLKLLDEHRASSRRTRTRREPVQRPARRAARRRPAPMPTRCRIVIAREQLDAVIAACRR